MRKVKRLLRMRRDGKTMHIEWVKTSGRN